MAGHASEVHLGVVSPRKVVSGGGVSRAGDLLLARVVRTVRERVHVVPVDQVDFVLAELGIERALWAERA